MNNISKKQKFSEAINRGYKMERGKVINKNNRIVGRGVCTNGYTHFAFRINGKYIRVMIHRFVAFLKFGDKIFEEGIVVRHKDGNNKNNNFKNILIGTSHDNMMDIPEEKRISRATNAASYLRKLSDDTVKEIRKFRKEGATYLDIKKKFGVNKSTLSFLFNYAKY